MRTEQAVDPTSATGNTKQIFSNYLNHIAGAEIDSPVVHAAAAR